MENKCENCIHYSVCEFKRSIDDTLCGHYKDKSLFVELPCKAGDIVYWCDFSTDEIMSAPLYEIKIDDSGEMWFEVGKDFPLGNEEMFLDRAEAERKLKEMGV